MFNLNKFISDSVTFRAESMFKADIETNKEQLTQEINGKSICVIGGAGSIGSSFIKAILPFKPATLVVVDLNENGLAELTRDIRSTYGMYVPQDYRAYTLNFADPIFERIFREEKGFDIVANFSAHKHVRSEKDKYSVQALIENNDIKAKKFMDLLCVYPPRHFFCVSTDKAANPVNIMGASKRIMEDLILAYTDKFKVTTARFANVAFSNGSLPAGWRERVSKKQPLAAPNDVKRYFVSLDELETKIPELIQLVHDGLYNAALERRNNMTYVANNMDEMIDIAENKPGFIKAMWCGDRECEDALKEQAGVSSRCIPFVQEKIGGTCVCCGKPADKMLYWGKAY